MVAKSASMSTSGLLLSQTASKSSLSKSLSSVLQCRYGQKRSLGLYSNLDTLDQWGLWDLESLRPLVASDGFLNPVDPLVSVSNLYTYI